MLDLYFFNYLELNENVIVFGVPTPIDIFDPPLANNPSIPLFVYSAFSLMLLYGRLGSSL